MEGVAGSNHGGDAQESVRCSRYNVGRGHLKPYGGAGAVGAKSNRAACNAQRLGDMPVQTSYFNSFAWIDTLGGISLRLDGDGCTSVNYRLIFLTLKHSALKCRGVGGNRCSNASNAKYSSVVDGCIRNSRN